MRLARRNLSNIFYALYEGREEVEDDNGYLTGETRLVYSKPKSIKANVSPAYGNVTQEIFGVSEGYDKVIIIAGTDCPIDEYSVLWIDSDPREKANYKVKRVSKSLNYTSIGVEKVNTDEL